jgi:hypothetical protein
VDADCWSLRGTTLLPPEKNEPDTGLISYFDQIFPESKCFIYKIAALYLPSFLSFFWRDSPQWARASSFTRFLDHTQRRTTVGRSPLDGDQLVAETST